MNVLVTGFEPFGGESINSSLEAVKLLKGLTIAKAQLHVREIPCVRYRSIEAVKEGIAECEPDIVLCIGQAGGRMDLSVERVGINIDDFRIPDNAGNQPIDEPIVIGAPSAYFSPLPIKEIAAAVRATGVPAAVSNSAGTFVCNHVFYGILHELAVEGRGRRGGFIHIPYLPEQAACRTSPQPSMSLHTVVAGLKAAIETAVINFYNQSEAGRTIR